MVKAYLYCLVYLYTILVISFVHVNKINDFDFHELLADKFLFWKKKNKYFDLKAIISYLLSPKERYKIMPLGS